jgi:hypothetical protein
LGELEAGLLKALFEVEEESSPESPLATGTRLRFSDPFIFRSGGTFIPWLQRSWTTSASPDLLHFKAIHPLIKPSSSLHDSLQNLELRESSYIFQQAFKSHAKRS